MKSFKLAMLLMSFSLLFVACGDPMQGNTAPGAATPAGPNVSFTAEIDGAAYESSLITAAQTSFTTAQGRGHQLILTGEHEDGRSINFSLQRLTNGPFVPGTYEFKPGNTHGASYVVSYKLSDSDSRLWDPAGDSGSLTIDKMTDSMISGSFDLTLYLITPSGAQDPIRITNGRFTSNNYNEFVR